jgi:hypothetical protein
MSTLHERLKDANEVESPDDRIREALATLPRRMQCKYVSADGTLCQNRRTGRSWCDECKQRVEAKTNLSMHDKQLIARLRPVVAGSD